MTRREAAKQAAKDFGRSVFSPDGCTQAPDGVFRPCCDWHDYQYRHAATAWQKFKADVGLFRCMLKQDKREVWEKLSPPIYFVAVATAGWLCWRRLGVKESRFARGFALGAYKFVAGMVAACAVLWAMKLTGAYPW